MTTPHLGEGDASLPAAEGIAALGFSSKVLASRRLMVSLLNDVDAEESLQVVAELAHAWTEADAAVVFLPSVGNVWIAEITSGPLAEHLLGTPFDLSPEALRQLTSGNSLNYPDLHASPLALLGGLDKFGPAILSPLNLEGNQQGTILVLRDKNKAPFTVDRVGISETLAMQIALILKIVEGQEAQERAAVLEERERISEDLHDLVIQEIFGAGMRLDALRTQAQERNRPEADALARELKETMTSLEQAVHQIRGIVYTLHGSDEKETFVQRLEGETSRARRVLGFAPSLVLQMDGVVLDPRDPATPTKVAELSGRVCDSVAGDALATIKESLSNVARHARAHSASVTIAVDGKGVVGELMVTIIDDGKGLPQALEHPSGLQNMGRRAERHGGSFAFGDGPRGRGTSLVWRVPLG